jgi:flagellar L-ring protein precursor FlgH
MMNKSIHKIAFAFLLAITSQACAVLPFLPLITEVPKMLAPTPSPASVQPVADAAPHEPDPIVVKAIETPPLGDAGVTISQVDRVAFQPKAEGSIPLRVAAMDLVSDVKAHSVGDVVTINVAETITSEAQAKTSLENKRSVSAGMPNLFGVAEAWAAKNPMVSLGSLINGSTDNATTGTGDMAANDTFTATMTAVVVAVNPAGTLSVKGDRHVRVNGEDDTIHLSGVIRPQDLDSNNTIASSQVADLEISLLGQGQVRDKQGNGTGTRLFDWLWPL